MGLQVPEQVISPAVIFAAEVAGERPDTLVSLADMSLEAVKLGERLAASRPVLQDPEADLLFFSRDVFPLLLDDLWRRRLRSVVVHADADAVGAAVAHQEMSAPFESRSTTHRSRRFLLLGVGIVNPHVPVQVISPAVALLAQVAGKRPDALVQLVDMTPEAVQL